jgi:hypothetical protein
MSGPVNGGRHLWAAATRVLLAILIAGAWSSSARAAQQVYFTSVTNVTDLIVQRIYAETVRLDISAWYLTEHAISIAILSRFQAGVPVRLIGDRGSIFEIDANTRREFYWLASQGVPIRLRYNPTWTPEIDHWKMGIFVGQNTVEFGSANWTTFELAPFSSTNYNDNTALFVDARDNNADDVALVAAFKARFDRIWNDTNVEPQSVGGGPPYLKNWNDACALESMCADYRTQYPNPAPMIIDTRRLEPDADTPPELIWGQGPEFNNRLVAEINAETTKVRFVIYRLTVDNITQALLNKWRSGVPVELIIEPNEYRNRVWPEFWLTRANIDRLWAAGLRTIKWRNPVRHAGLTHMKTLVTSAYATNASSNYASAWQRDHNYFVPAATKPATYSAIRNQVAAMYASLDFQNFVPEPPDAANLASPGSGATGFVAGTPLVWNRAAFATSYDVYLGTTQANMTWVANVPAQLVNNPPTAYSWTPPASMLQPGTTYVWGVISRTFATDADNSIYAVSSVWSFTTAGGGGGGGGPLPAPWATQDVGSVGTPGSASYSNGTFTVAGAGANIGGTSDAFRFVSQQANGDLQMWARITSIQNTNASAKAGVMLRESLAANAAHVTMDIKPGGAIEMMTRSSTGAQASVIGSASRSLPVFLGMVRSGNTVTGYVGDVSGNGVTWTAIGSTSFNAASAVAGMVVSSANTSVLNTSTFDTAAVEILSPPPPPPPPPSGQDVVIYASDSSIARHGSSWAPASSSSSPGGMKLVTPDAGVANLNAPLATPTDYVDIPFNANAGTYRIWLRLQATGNSKLNDAVWVQFSDAVISGSPAYRMNTTSGLLVNLATDASAASLNGWGWQNTAYWLSQQTAVTFNTSGAHTLRIQIREDGVQFDQIVMSPSTYFNQAPGPPTADSTIVQKP